MDDDGKIWRAKSWMKGSTKVVEAICSHLLTQSSTSRPELEKVRALSYAQIENAVKAALPDITKEIADSVTQLNELEEVDAQRLNSKFAADENSFTYIYGGMDTYHQGLEGYIGNPDPDVFAAMEYEHTGSAYAHRQFKDGKGAIRNASSEWEYVVAKPAVEVGDREKGHEGMELQDFIDFSGEGCVQIVSDSIYHGKTGQLVHQPVSIKGRKIHGQLLVERRISFKSGKFAQGLDLECSKTYQVKIGDEEESIVGADLSYYSGSLQPGVQYHVILHRSDSASAVMLDGIHLKWHDVVFRADLRKEEVVAGRLYTGPCYMWYNHILRWLKQPLPFDDDFLNKGQCWSACAVDKRWPKQWKLVKYGTHYATSVSPVPEKFDDDKFYGIRLHASDTRGEKRGKYLSHADMFELPFVTTIHVLNSLILKLSRVQAAEKVYRGLKGGVLPSQFWEANEYGVRGGIELGFMSTTLDKDVAFDFAKKGGASTVFEIQMGMIDRGGDLQWCSQYPLEAEILFAPLTGLEVACDPKVEGSTILVELRLNCNLHDMTIEEVTSKMKKAHSDLVKAIRTGMSRTGFEDLHIYDEEMEPYSAFDGQWYVSASNYKAATTAALTARSKVYQSKFPLLQSCETAEHVKLSNVLDGAHQDYFSPKLSGQGPMFARVLSELIPSNKNLRTLDVSGNNLAHGEGRWFVIFVNALGRQCSMLSDLNVSGNDIWDMEAEAVAALLLACGSLTSVNLSNNRIHSKGAKAVADVLPKCTLTSLNLRGNNLTLESYNEYDRIEPGQFVPAGTEVLILGLQKREDLNGTYGIVDKYIESKSGVPQKKYKVTLPAGEVVSLKFENMQFPPRDGLRVSMSGITALAESISLNPILTALHLSGNSLGLDGCEVVCRMMKTNTVVQHLTLDGYNYYSNIGLKGTQTIAEMLQANRTLVSIKLSVWHEVEFRDGLVWHEVEFRDGLMSAPTVTVLSSALPQCHALRTLDISGNSMSGDAKANYSLFKHADIHTFDDATINTVADNFFQSPLVTLVFGERSVTVDTSMAKIDVSNNALDIGDAMILAAFLPKCSSLTSLNISGNLMGRGVSFFPKIKAMFAHSSLLPSAWSVAMESAGSQQQEDLKEYGLTTHKCFSSGGSCCEYPGCQSCFGPMGVVQMHGGGTKLVKDVRVGDRVRTAAPQQNNNTGTVVHVVISHPPPDVKFCKAANGLVISPKHPVFIHGKWMHPDEIIQPTLEVDRVYNFELVSDASLGNTMFVNGVMCATLGWGDGTDRLFQMSEANRRLDAVFGRGWKDRLHRSSGFGYAQVPPSLTSAFQQQAYDDHQQTTFSRLYAAARNSAISLTSNFILYLHQLLCPTVQQGFRQEPVAIKINNGYTRHHPPNAPAVRGLVASFCTMTEQYFHEGHDAYAIAAMCVWWVCNVHPFVDGNGHVARCLASLILAKAGQLPKTMGVACFHKPFYSPRLRAEYFCALQQVNEAVGMCSCCCQIQSQPAATMLPAAPHIAVFVPLVKVLRDAVSQLEIV